MQQLFRTLLFLTLSGSALANDPIETLVLEGDVIPGVGAVTSITNLNLSPLGSWLVELDTDNADTDADGVLIIDGAVFQIEGQALIDPPGTTLDFWDSTFIDPSGNTVQNNTIDGTPNGTNDDTAVYFNDAVLIQEGDVSTNPGYAPGTTYEGFFEARVTSSRLVFVMTSVDDPTIASTVDRGLTLIQLDAGGNPTSESVLYKEGDVIPALAPEAVTDFGTSPHEMALTTNGLLMYGVDLTGDTATNAALLLTNVVLGGADTLIAREGDPSPVAGRNYATLTSVELDVNIFGEYVFSCSLDGDTSSNLLLVKNGAKFRQEGDNIAAIPAGTAFTSFGSGPVDIDNFGNVLWYGDWDDPDTDVDTGLFLNDLLLVQEGVTTVNGLVVDSLSGVQDGYFLADDGSWVIFEATLEGGLNGAFRIDLSGGLSYCQAKASSSGCLASICNVTPGRPTSGATDYTVDVTGVEGLRNGLVFFGVGGPANLPFLGGTLCVQPPIGRTAVQQSGGMADTCTGSYALVVNDGTGPDQGPGTTAWLQCWYRDPDLMDGFDSALSNAIQLDYQ